MKTVFFQTSGFFVRMSSASETYHAPYHARARMIREVLRRDEPRYRRQRADRRRPAGIDEARHRRARSLPLRRRRRCTTARRASVLRGSSDVRRECARRAATCARAGSAFHAASVYTARSSLRRRESVAQVVDSCVSRSRASAESSATCSARFVLRGSPPGAVGEERRNIGATTLREPDVVLREPLDRIVARICRATRLRHRCSPESKLISF